MSGSVFLALVTFVVLLALSIFMTPLALIPAVLLVGAFLLSGPLLGALRGGDGRHGAGTPSTSEASYDPTTTPGQRSV